MLPSICLRCGGNLTSIAGNYVGCNNSDYYYSFLKSSTAIFYEAFIIDRAIHVFNHILHYGISATITDISNEITIPDIRIDPKITLKQIKKYIIIA